MEENRTLIFVLYAAGLALCAGLYAFRLGRAGRRRSCAVLGLLCGLPLAYAGGKLFFLLHNALLDVRNWSVGDLFSLQWEELSFTGGCVGMALGVWIAARAMGIPGGEALDLFTVPGCLLMAFARMAEAGMGTIGQGDMPSFLPEVFPFAVTDDWGSSLAVFSLEALAALCCGVWILLTERKQDRPGANFERACIMLCAAQLFLEMLIVNYWIPLIISFIHLEQVACAVILLVLLGRRAARTKKAGPLLAAVLLMGLNALMQYVQDKPYLFPLPDWAEVGTLAVIVYALTSAGIMAAGRQSRLSKGS